MKRILLLALCTLSALYADDARTEELMQRVAEEMASSQATLAELQAAPSNQASIAQQKMHFAFREEAVPESLDALQRATIRSKLIRVLSTVPGVTTFDDHINDVAAALEALQSYDEEIRSLHHQQAHQNKSAHKQKMQAAHHEAVKKEMVDELGAEATETAWKEFEAQQETAIANTPDHSPAAEKSTTQSSTVTPTQTAATEKPLVDPDAEPQHS